MEYGRGDRGVSGQSRHCSPSSRPEPRRLINLEIGHPGVLFILMKFEDKPVGHGILPAGMVMI